MKEMIRLLVEKLKAREDFDDEFYLTYIGELNDGDLGEWHTTHFEDTIEMGAAAGATMATADIIGELEEILGSEK